VRQPHQHVVADQVGLGEIEPGRVQALEDQLRVVVVTLERDIDNQQLLGARYDRLERQWRPPRVRRSCSTKRL
jgi:hypothetical protein